MELSRKRMYAERSERNRSILLYTAGSVSSPFPFRPPFLSRWTSSYLSDVTCCLRVIELDGRRGLF